MCVVVFSNLFFLVWRCVDLYGFYFIWVVVERDKKIKFKENFSILFVPVTNDRYEGNWLFLFYFFIF